MARYTVLLAFDPEGPRYVVTVPTLPGCFDQGSTVDAALVRAKEAITGHVATLRELGEAVPVEAALPIVASVDTESVTAATPASSA